MPTLGLTTPSFNGRLSKSLMILFTFFEKRYMEVVFFETAALHTLSHFWCNASAEPGTASYGLVAYKALINTSP